MSLGWNDALSTNAVPIPGTKRNTEESHEPTSVLPSQRGLKHGAILYNEAEVFSLSITNPNGRPMLPFDWLIHSSLILASCHRILFFCQFSAVEK